jgi:DNA-directed RNA polymerase subunit RPC12/RpoP
MAHSVRVSIVTTIRCGDCGHHWRFDSDDYTHVESAAWYAQRAKCPECGSQWDSPLNLLSGVES